MTAYYNEFDPYAAEWLRNLIDAGHIAPGVVDSRSILDVSPADLAGFTQCHFFAGVGVWSLALRRAGWPDDRPIWTGSCPCQPFSVAGKGAGFADERHLWPYWHWLIEQCRPAVVAGEQVASKDVDPWIDLVSADLEGLGYAVGAVAFPSAGVGAPHIRDRTYWVAHADGGSRRQGRAHVRGWASGGDAQPWAGLGGGGVLDGLANASGARPQGCERAGQRDDAQRAASERDGAAGGLADDHQHGRATPSIGRGNDAEHHVEPRGESGGVADDFLQQRPHGQPRVGAEHDQGGRVEGSAAAARLRDDLRPGPTNGLWRAADWLLCRDGRWRPVEPGTFPLVDGASARVGRLRAYGNAINAEAARVFIEAVMECA